MTDSGHGVHRSNHENMARLGVYGLCRLQCLAAASTRRVARCVRVDSMCSERSLITLIQRLRRHTILRLLSVTRADELKKQTLLSWRLSNSKKIYVFRYGATELRALTADGTGRALPSQTFPAGWCLERSVTVRLGKKAPKRELTKATLAAIAAHGFYLMHTAIHTLPITLANDRASGFSAATQSPLLGAKRTSRTVAATSTSNR